jgi:outer membrane protein assembly factor BamB
MLAPSRPCRTRLVWLCLVAVGAALGLSRPAGAEIVLPMSTQWIQSMGYSRDADCAPLPLGSHVFLTYDGALRCLDVLTGAELWKTKVEEDSSLVITTAPVAYRDSIIVGNSAGQLLRMAADGTTVWKAETNSSVAPDPLVLDDLVIAAAKQEVAAYSAATGKWQWSATLNSGVKYGPVTDGSSLYFLCYDGSVACVSASGRARWQVPVPSGPKTFPLTIANDRVIVAAGTTLYTVGRTGVVRPFPELPAAIAGPVRVEGDTILVPCVDDRIIAVSARSGRPERAPEYQTDGNVTSRPLLTERSLIAATGSGLVYGFDRETGAVRWIYRCRAPEQPLDEPETVGVYAPLVATDSTVYCLTGTGDLYSFTSAPGDSSGPQFAACQPEPGGDPVSPEDTVVLSCAAYDDSTGVDPRYVELYLDDKPVSVRYDAPSGVITAVLANPSEGSHVVRAVARDFRGNTNSYEWSFLVDPNAEPKEPEPDRLTGRTGAQRGGAGGGMRGGGGGGGMRGGGGGGGGGGMRGGGGGGMRGR